jgi:beta-lactamase class A
MSRNPIVWMLAALALACSGPAASPTPPAASPTAVAAAAAPPHAAPTDAPRSPALPDDPAGRELAWVLDVISRGHADKTEIEAHFAAGFLAQVPATELSAGIAQLHGLRLVDARSDGSGARLTAHAELDGQRVKIELALDRDRKIEGLLFAPADSDPLDKPATWEAADQALHAAAPHAQILAAELDRGRCKPVHAVEPAQELAIGSTFKLYVLLALADRITAGKLAWDTPIAVRDDWKSLPSGTTQNEAAGAKLTVRQLADKMISISDNTAADHLLYTIGRTRVENALRIAHHAAPDRDTPFVSTRELFVFKLATQDDDIERYLKLPTQGRRAYLDTLADKLPALSSAASWKTARHIAQLEWFASSEDLCRVMDTLRSRAQQPKLAPILDVLAINPGMPIDRHTWSYAGFKGGSEPGVIDLTWLVRRADGRWFVLTLTANSDEGGSVSENKLVGIAAGMLDLLAKEP